MKFKLIASIAIISTVAMLTGCGGSKPKPAAATAAKAQTHKFAIGKATKDEVIATLGNPNGVSHTSDGLEILTYNSTHLTGKAFIPFYFGGGKVQSHVAMYKFKNNILTDYSESSNSY